MRVLKSEERRMPAMATGTVADERAERKRELAETSRDAMAEPSRDAMAAAMEDYVAAELAASVPGDGGSHPALLDRRIRRGALSAARRAVEKAYGDDRSDCGAENAPACAGCGERMRYVGRDESPVETALGRVAVPMARHACDRCATTVRPRERALDVEGSMTPSARRMASLRGRRAATRRPTGCSGSWRT